MIRHRCLKSFLDSVLVCSFRLPDRYIDSKLKDQTHIFQELFANRVNTNLTLLIGISYSSVSAKVSINNTLQTSSGARENTIGSWISRRLHSLFGHLVILMNVVCHTFQYFINYIIGNIGIIDSFGSSFTMCVGTPCQIVPQVQAGVTNSTRVTL